MQKKCYYCDTVLASGLCPLKCPQPTPIAISSIKENVASASNEVVKAPKISVRNSLVGKGATHLKLPDGTIIQLSDFIEKSYYSTLVLEPRQLLANPIELFSYSRSQHIAGSLRLATGVHTNIPRPGFHGLPQAYMGIVFGWRAVSDLDSPEFRRWAMTTRCVFKYNNKFYMETSLYELLRKPSLGELEETEFEGFDPPRDAPFMIPVVMQSNLEFAVIIESLDLVASKDFAESLNHESLIRIHLDGLWKCPLV